MRYIKKDSADEYVLVILIIKFIENMLCTTSITRCFTYIISFNLHKNFKM